MQSFGEDAVEICKVELHKVSRFMSYILPVDAEKFQLYKTIESKTTLPVTYRMDEAVWFYFSLMVD